VFLVLDKGDRQHEMLDLRRRLIEDHGRAEARVIELADTRRGTDVPYGVAVAGWHAERSLLLERTLIDEVRDGEVAALLVWGDPSLYDSTLRLLDEVQARSRVALDITVVPGVSSVQLLAARHRIVLNRVGGPLLITTARQLAEHGVPPGIDDVVVMLDGRAGFRSMTGQGFDIYWGAYLGMDGEVLVAGVLDDVADRIETLLAAGRAARGWVFDIYLLRRRKA
jgi:precorrin-6A synthase